jgi:predicted O-methyltransferase YrrM
LDRKLLFFRLKEYIMYRLRAKDEHGIHSPFLFNLYKELMEIEVDNKDFYFAENFRNELLSADESIRKINGNNASKRLLPDEVESSAMPKASIQLIYKLVRKFQPKTIIELGTNAGLSSLYLALAMKGLGEVDIFTIEKNDDLYDKAAICFAMMRHSFIGLPNVNFIKGDFREQLPLLLNKINTLDFLLVDGDHEEQSTLDYFKQCLTKASGNSIFVFDDIYWSPGMLSAWQQIISHPSVTLSIDLHKMGILFFDPKFSKEHFTLKWAKNKPEES